MDDLDALRMDAAFRVLRKWRSYRDRRIFKYLKHAICRAEESLTHQVLRKINPLEASILRDPTLHARLRFRFGGDSFPPVILYKIFINASVQYVSGATQILPGSEAAYDACGEMGERKYFDIVLGDIERQTPIADQRLMDMAFGMQDRLKEHGNFDSHPVFMGGKGNSWRVLVDDKYTCNENALRFDPNSEALSGKKLRILDEVLASMERTMMERAAATPLPPVKKEFASQSVLQRIQTSQQRARSRQMHQMYMRGHMSEGGGGEGEAGGGSPSKQHQEGFFPQKSSDLEAAAFDEAMRQMGQRPDLDESGATRRGGGKSGNFEDVGEGGDEDFDPTDALLDWAGQLSFENYHEMWERTAATVVDLG